MQRANPMNAKHVVSLADETLSHAQNTTSLRRTHGVGIESGSELRAFVDRIYVDVEKYWFAPQLSEHDILLMLQGEVSELGQWFGKEKRDSKSYTDKVALEFVDILFFFAKVVKVLEFDIEKEWNILMDDPSSWKALLWFTEEKSNEEIAQFMSFLSDCIGILRRFGENHGVTVTRWDGYTGVDFPTIDMRTAVCSLLYLSLKLMEKLDIDLDDAWQKKMEINSQRFAQLKR